MKIVDIQEMEASAEPVRMTRREKLMRWARLVRETAHPHLHIYHGLEYMSRDRLREVSIEEDMPTAFGVAAADPQFQAEGFGPRNTILGTMN